MRITKYHALSLALLLSLTGCSNNNEPPAAGKAPAATQQEEKAKAPHAAIKVAPPKADDALQGTVVETFSSGGYTYLLLDNGKEKIWAAMAETPVEVGQKLSLINGPVMKDFHSRTLDRTFAEIVFSAGIKGQNSGAHGQQAQASTKEGSDDGEAAFMEALKGGDTAGAPIEIDPALASGGSTKAIVNFQEIKLDKIQGGYTVGEIFSQAEQLNGKTIKLRGQVVKVSPKIMGTNWYHIQDGTGDPMHNTHDLVVTSNQPAEKGDVLVIEGKVAAKKDFGAGYFYEAIIEQASFSK